MTDSPIPARPNPIITTNIIKPNALVTTSDIIRLYGIKYSENMTMVLTTISEFACREILWVLKYWLTREFKVATKSLEVVAKVIVFVDTEQTY